MITKTFEVRDAMTFIPVLAIKLQPGCEADRYLLARSGYGSAAFTQESYVLLLCLTHGQGTYNSDPCEWEHQHVRTIPQAHQYILEHFDELESGAVVDVEYILGEKQTPKKSEREDRYGRD